MFVRSYSGKTFFGLTVITGVIWVNGQIFSFLLENLLVPIYTEKLKPVSAVVGEELLDSDTHTHTQTLTCDIDPVPISIYFKF